MQCQCCQFENMPGQQRCFKCNSILEGEGPILNIHPPRMRSWQRPIRRARRLLRREKVVPDRDKSSRAEWDWSDIYGKAIQPSILSVIPGLAQAKQGRFRPIRWFMAAWLLLIVLTCAMYASSWGWMALGMAAAIHAWIALDAGLRDTLDSVMDRLRVLMLTFVIIFAGYGLLIRVVPGYFIFERTALAIPSQEMQPGDILLLHPLQNRTQTLARGTVVQYQSRTVGNEARVSAIGQIIGLPNEVVSLYKRVYYVDGIELPAEDYPVPAWIPDSSQTLTVGPGQYFISTEFRVQGRRNRANDAIWRLCLVSWNDIESQATMLWWPMNRRHSLRPH